MDSAEKYSGDQQVSPVKSLSAAHLFAAIINLIYVRYNAYGHYITHVVADSVPAFEPVIPMLSAMGILLTLTPHGQHARRVERYVGAVAGRRRALLASLPYVLPARYSVYARQWIAETANGLPNTLSHPSCADLIVTGHRRPSHFKFPELCFGDCCLVSMFDNKGRATAHVHA